MASIDADLYNSLSSLGDAHARRQEPGIDDIISGPIRNVFLKHGMEKQLCLYLQHAHHRIATGQAIVKVEGTAHQMDHEDMAAVTSFGNKIVPATWMSTVDGVEPMEFAVAPADTDDMTPPPSFLSDFTAALAANQCTGLFGIDTLASNPWAELSVGNASVVVPNTDSDSDSDSVFIPVALAFEAGKPGFVVHGKCSKNQNKHTSTPDKPRGGANAPKPKPKPKPTPKP